MYNAGYRNDKYLKILSLVYINICINAKIYIYVHLSKS